MAARSDLMPPAIERIWLEVALPVRRALPAIPSALLGGFSRVVLFSHSIDRLTARSPAASQLWIRRRGAPHIGSVLAGDKGVHQDVQAAGNLCLSLFGPGMSSAARTWTSLRRRHLWLKEPVYFNRVVTFPREA
jgi:hypothetical protein